MMLKTEVIKRFLEIKALPDLAALYNANMEVQVNVLKLNGKRIDSEFKGKRSHGYTDGNTTWKPIRIPWNAKTDPQYTDSESKYDLNIYCEGIGLTGWDWGNRLSRWVGFDYDAITGHSDRHTRKMTDREFEELERAVSNLPYVTLRQSTSGKGRHLYVFVEPVTTSNHDEHAALARAILGKMSGEIGFDFNNKVDVVGGILWIWHRKFEESNREGLKLIKQGSVLASLPINWREHVPVISGRKKKTVPIFINNPAVDVDGQPIYSNTDSEESFNELAGQHSNVQRDFEHIRLINWLNENELNSWWDNDHHMLVTHTAYLDRAHQELGLTGVFKTIAHGTEYGHDINCFCFSGDTEIITHRGISKIGDLYDSKVRLLVQITPNRTEWIESEIRYFGRQNVCHLNLSNGIQIKTTQEHQWPYYDLITATVEFAKRRSTMELLSTTTNGFPISESGLLYSSELTANHLPIPSYARIKDLNIFSDNYQDVYCAVVPHYHNFYLANGVLTGNCFPMRNGAWSVRRYSKGTGEAETWSQDNKGYTRCYFNKPPDFDIACTYATGNRNDKEGFVFGEAELAGDAIRLLGGNLIVPAEVRSRKTTLLKSKTDKLVVNIERQDGDPHAEMRNLGFNPEGRGQTKFWQRVFPINLSSSPMEAEVQNYDDIIRHLITEDNEEYGWAMFSEGTWKKCPIENAKLVLAAFGETDKESKIALGALILKSWKVVNRPFEPEYLEGRTWNMNAVQFAVLPNKDERRSFPNWQKILDHLGKNLNDAVLQNEWCQENNIITGAAYLKCWMASVIQHPLEPLPYLFFYSNAENSGKSVYPESMRYLFTKGVVRGDASLINQQAFNAELEHAVVAYVQEINLSNKASLAYNRIKDWLTARELPIHRKNKTPYLQPNSVHWIQTANDVSFCPIFPGDTRIVVIKVDPLTNEEKIPKYILEQLLKKEAADFLGELVTLELPDPIDRLYIPVIETEAKSAAQEMNSTPVERFLLERYHYVEGHMITLDEFLDSFQDWLKVKGEHDQIPEWGKIKITRSLKEPWRSGRSRKDNYVNLINISIDPNATPLEKLVIHTDGKIYRESELAALIGRNGR